jgi:hypothetical protein
MANPSKYTINAEVVQITEQNHGTIIGKQINDADDSGTDAAIADLQSLLIQLQTQHPTAIIDAEFTEIKRNPTHKLATLRQQILNPDRHLQATKATLVEITKAYWEQSLIAKAIVTYIDKLSETPGQGA